VHQLQVPPGVPSEAIEGRLGHGPDGGRERNDGRGRLFLVRDGSANAPAAGGGGGWCGRGNREDGQARVGRKLAWDRGAQEGVAHRDKLAQDRQRRAPAEKAACDGTAPGKHPLLHQSAPAVHGGPGDRLHVVVDHACHPSQVLHRDWDIEPSFPVEHLPHNPKALLVGLFQDKLAFGVDQFLESHRFVVPELLPESDQQLACGQYLDEALQTEFFSVRRKGREGGRERM